MKIGIVGLGLMGGSFAKALKKYTSHEVYAYDIDYSLLHLGVREGSINQVLNQGLIFDCDLIVLAVMPEVAIQFVKDNGPMIKGTVLDFCGVKRVMEKGILPIAKERGFKYLGGHPMAGRERGGYENSVADLFQGASMIFVENETSQGEGKNWEELFRRVGFEQIKYSSSEDHDRILAYTSQLAHVVSNSFVQSETHNEEYGYSADSLRDLTRVATLDVDMWTKLFFYNKDFLVEEVRRISDQLSQYAEAIEKKDEKSLKEMLTKGVLAKKEMEERRKKQ